VSDAKEIVEEFGGNRIAMAAEILRLRAALVDVSFDLSRAAAAGISGLLLDASPPAKAPRPIGYRPR
jgi:hypothetical protein